MKISIITVCYNAADTLGDTLDSVAAQNYSNVEHIIVDGGSVDGTEEVVNDKGRRVTVWRSESDRGVYDGMNKGLLLASGEVIGFLNADDVYIHSDVLARVAATMADPVIDACYANLVYVERKQTSRVVRHWTSQNYTPGLFEKGWMPAHPTFFVRKSVYEKLGGFNLRYRLQSDFASTDAPANRRSQMVRPRLAASNHSTLNHLNHFKHRELVVGFFGR
ncbi:MAG: glycosyltransferase family 2 protein, partial [Nitrosomonadaceae bacterium]